VERSRPVPALGARLRAVIDLVPAGARVADVGSDHGLVPAALLAEGIASWCVATERNGPRRRSRPPGAASVAARERFEFRYGDGLAAVHPADRVDTLILAGMGGGAVLAILDRGALTGLGIGTIVAQPQTRHAAVRAFLRRIGFALSAERMVAEGGRRYLVLAARRGTETAYDGVSGLTVDDLLEAGPLLVRDRDPVARGHWEARRERFRRLVAHGNDGPGRRARAEYDRAERVLAALRRPAATAI